MCQITIGKQTFVARQSSDGKKKRQEQTSALPWTGTRAAAIKPALINQTSPVVVAVNNELRPRKLCNTINWEQSSTHLQYQFQSRIPTGHQVQPQQAAE